MRGLGCLLLLALLGLGAYLVGRDYIRDHPQDVPWTELRLSDPVGRFTAGKIASLGDDAARCEALLEQASVRHQPVPPRRSPPNCGYDDGVRVAGGDVSYRPAGLVTSCPAAAALHLLESRVVQPAAQRHFGRPATQILHAGSYSCRRLYGRSEGEFSEHATADAVDIIGFGIEGGHQVSVLHDWSGEGRDAAFLRDVRDGACRLFSTVLSPEYNEAHRDHFHLDVSNRGRVPWTVCR